VIKRMAVPLVLAASLIVPGAGPAWADGASEEVLERLELLTEELRRIKDRMDLPATDAEMEGQYGLGPGASQVYRRNPGLSVGGYGEFYFEQPTGDGSADRTADLYRFITYFGYKFSDRIVMNTEIEFEHATTGKNFQGRAGSVSVEFGYVDFLLNDGVNIRTGNLLMPVGFVNRMHEPPFYRGNFRPFVERSLLPSTWRSLGAGLHGEPSPGVAYEAYLVSGMDAFGFGSSGIRGGRQSGGRVIWEDVAGVLALDVTSVDPLRLGGSVVHGQADQNRQIDGRDANVTVTVAEGHAGFRRGGFEGRALIASVAIGEAAALSRELSDGTGTVTVPRRQLGWYLEGAYDIAPWVGIGSGTQLLAWARWEDWDLHRDVANGFTRDPALDGRAVTVGLELKPHPSVVVKADATFESDEAGSETGNPLRVGVGFVF
jgi:hypothetical protein